MKHNEYPFRVGDNVILRKPVDCNCWLEWLPRMNSLDGKIVTIKYIDKDIVKFYEKATDGVDFYYSVDWIEIVADEDICQDIDMKVLF